MDETEVLNRLLDDPIEPGDRDVMLCTLEHCVEPDGTAQVCPIDGRLYDYLQADQEFAVPAGRSIRLDQIRDI